MGKRADYDPADYQPKQYPTALKEVLAHEFSEQFTDGMKNRMLVSNAKYGNAGHNCPERCDAIACLNERIEKYQATGNVEWLMDVANFAMIEFMHPSRPDAHFRPTDSHESPGRVRKDGGNPHEHIHAPDPALARLRERHARGQD